MKFDFTIELFNLALIPVFSFLLVFIMMKTAEKIRGKVILNPEDHRKSNIIGFALVFALLISVCLFTPLTVGIFFWGGVVFILLAAVLYILSILSLIKNRRGFASDGIYARTRNPMYVAMIFYGGALTLMALQSSWIAALLLSLCTLGFRLLIGKRIAHEEVFLADAFGTAFLEYKRRTPRFIFR